MKRFDVLDKNTPVFGHFFLEASAGTGKTFAIEHIVVRSLLESKEPLTIDQILVVTFTRAATRELKNRVKKSLLKTLFSLQMRVDGPDYLSTVFQEGEEAIFSAKRKIEEALSCFDSASIFTLHGFCHRCLTDNAFETGSFFDMPSPEALSHREKMLQVVEDFFRAGLTPDLYSPAQIAILLKKGQGSLEGLAERICDVIEKNVTIQADQPFSYYVNQVKKAFLSINHQYVFSVDHAIEDLKKLLPLYKRTQDVDLLLAERLCHALQGRDSVEDILDELLLAKECFLSLIQEDNLKKGKDPSLLSLSCPGLWHRMNRELSPLIDRAKDSAALFLRAASDSAKIWKGSIYYEDSLSPDDLLKKMADAVSNAIFKEKISDRYKLAIIDEFQDTDPLQWHIFNELFVKAKTLKTIYLVGDPKQSIYAFRNADVYTYMEALRALGEENRLFLDTNFRSRSSLVKALNTLFTCHISPQWMQLPSSKSSLEVRAVGSKEPFTEHERGQERSSVHFFVAEGSIGRARRWPTEEIEEGALLPFVASEILRLKEKEGYRFGQVAVLVRDRFQAERLEGVLKKYKVPLSVQRSLSLSTSPAYLAVYDVICAVISPEDVGALKRVLGGPFIGHCFSSLIGGMELEIVQEARMYFEKERNNIAKTGWSAFFTRFLRSAWQENGVCIEEDLLSRESSSLYFEVRQLLQLMLSADHTSMFCLDSFARYFKSLVDLSSDDEALKVPRETEEDEVVVMTIHASKGLEFDVVFALGLVSRTTSSDDLVTIRSDKESFLTPRIEEDPLCALASLETDAEKMRHLYVALTRAKDRVYVPIAIETDKKAIAPYSASAIELLIQSFGKDDFNFTQAYEEMAFITKDQILSHLDKLSSLASIGYTLVNKELWDDPFLASKEELVELVFTPSQDLCFPRKRVVSFSSLHKESEGFTFSTQVEPLPHDVLPLGADTGTILHAIMEDVFRAGLHGLCDEEGIKKCIEKHIMTTSLKCYDHLILHMIKESLLAPIGSDEKPFCLCDVKAEDLYLEMEFSFAINGNRMKGFIDALCFFDGKYYILDWKSNFLGILKEDYTKIKIQEAMLHHGYFLQAAIYAEALKRYLSVIEKRAFSELFGGAVYLFMRGAIGYHFQPDLSLLNSKSLEIGYNEP